MRKSYRLSREARTDLLQALNYLAENASFTAADKLISGLYDAMDKIARLPGLGHFRTDLTGLPVRFFRVNQYLIVYVSIEERVTIVRILHASRDIRSILDKG